jgi:hypothetical protein
LKNENLSTAWLRTEKGTAIVCAWCADAAVAEKRAASSGLVVSHGICPECAARQSARDVTVDSFAVITPFPGAQNRGTAFRRQGASREAARECAPGDSFFQETQSEA